MLLLGNEEIDCMHKEDCGDELPDVVNQVVRKRCSVYADKFNGKQLPQAVLKEILINATCAPTHKMTEPWRFIVFEGKYLKEYGEYLVNFYREYYSSKLSPSACEEKLAYLKEYPQKTACLLGVVMQRSTHVNIPEWEELAAVSCAVQNIALSCTAYGVGGYWCTADAAIDFVQQFGLKDNETSLGLFFIGYTDDRIPSRKKKRTHFSQKTTFLT